MDVQKLIATGKIRRTIILNGFKFELSTPPMSRLANLQTDNQFMNIAQFVDKIDDEDFTAVDAKPKLSEILAQLQPGLMTKIAEACNAMTEEQNKAITGMFSEGKS